jgi:natural product precursor
MDKKLKLTELTKEELRQVVGGKQTLVFVVCRCKGHSGPPSQDFRGSDDKAKGLTPFG